MTQLFQHGVKAVEGTMLGMSLFAYDENSKPAIAYNNFCKEVLKSEKQRIRYDVANIR